MLAISSDQLDLLKAALLSGTSAQEAWQRWVQRIDFDQIDPASYKLLPLVSRNPALQTAADPIFSKCQGVYRQTWAENQLRWKRILPALQQLQEVSGEKILLLKGIAMILHHYRDFGIRVIGDIDFLIPKPSVGLADRFLRTSGWTPHVAHIDVNTPKHLDRWHALNFSGSLDRQLDLHWSFLEENSPFVDAQVWQGAILSLHNLYIPNPTDLLLQTCVHGVKPSPVPLIRWIADAMTILKSAAVDWERLVRVAKEAHLCRPLIFALPFLVKEFQADIPLQAILALKTKTLRLQTLEYRWQMRGYPEVAGWYRYCLNRGYVTFAPRLLSLGPYIQTTGELSAPLLVLRWIYRRLRRWRLSFKIFKKSVL